MTSVTVRVPAKINLCLGVGGRRQTDGFHSLATVYQAVDIYDEIRATDRDDDSITVTVHSGLDAVSEDSHVPENGDNLAAQAAAQLRDATGATGGVDLAIRKAIPVAGGMAGGSADAAATLVACNELWGLKHTKYELEPIAARVGSDVPFLLHGGNAVGSGRGETISPVLARGTYHWVIATASHGLSTASVYAEFDRLTAEVDVPEPQVPDELLTALRAADPDALGAQLSNDLTDAALSLRPELAETLAIGQSAGALGAMISGSGPTCLFLVRDDQHGLDVAIALSSASSAADVIQSAGPVAGARLITS